MPVTPRPLLAWIATGLVLAALYAETGRARRLLGASRRLHTVEQTSARASAFGGRREALLLANLKVLDVAAAMDPAEVGIPLARGSVYYLLGRLEPAIESYRAALRLEARPEVHLNLGRALYAHGATAEGEREMRRGTRLDPRLARELPR